jgi:hypothetical protein
MAHEAPQLSLPDGIVTLSDLGRVGREAETVDNFMKEAAIREPGSAVQLPKTSRMFEELVSANHLNMLQAADRTKLIHFLQDVRNRAPVLHVSFNSDPSPLFAQRLVTWIRQEIHPFALLQVGLYPNIGAGCVVRTTNKFFDFSLREQFKKQRPLLISKLRAAPEEAKA